MRYLVSLLIAAVLVAIAVVIFALVLRPREVKQSQKTVVPIVLAEKVWTCPKRIALKQTKLEDIFVVDANLLAQATAGAYRFDGASIYTGSIKTWSDERHAYSEERYNGYLTCYYQPIVNEGYDKHRNGIVSLHLAQDLIAEPYLGGESVPWAQTIYLQDFFEEAPTSDLSPPRFYPVADVIRSSIPYRCNGGFDECTFHVRPLPGSTATP